jgi:dihydrofolate synthase / folylpolyglutamate synthase
MTYQQTVEYLFSRLPAYQTQGKSAYKPDLSNTIALCKLLGNPEKNIKSIHVAGTNGKGSTCHMLASVFQEAGYKVGLYSSPHLKDFRERIKINGLLISEEEVVAFVNAYKEKFEAIQLSFFEWTTGLAFYHFAQQKVDIAIIETGLGGRLDSTNVITPELSIITNIGLDHVTILGNTLEKIAFEKAGIIKQQTHVIIGEIHSQTKPVFERIAREKNAQIYFATPHHYPTDLLGNYQKTNVNTVVSAISILSDKWKISDDAIKNGLLHVVKNTGLLGRWQILSESPKMICDVGHNAHGIQLIIEQLNNENYHHLHMVLGFVNDKDINPILKLLPKNANYYFCNAQISRALPAETLKEHAEKWGLKGESFKSVQEALNKAKACAQPNDLILLGVARLRWLKLYHNFYK